MPQISKKQATEIIEETNALAAARTMLRKLSHTKSLQVVVQHDFGGDRRNYDAARPVEFTSAMSDDASRHILNAVRRYWEQRRDHHIRKLHQLGAEIPPEVM